MAIRSVLCRRFRHWIFFSPVYLISKYASVTINVYLYSVHLGIWNVIAVFQFPFKDVCAYVHAKCARNLAMHAVLWITYTWRCLWRNVTLFQNVTTFSWRKSIGERRTLDSVPVETCSYIVFDSDQRCVPSHLILCCVWSASWRRLTPLKTVSTSVIYLSTNMLYKLRRG